MQVFAYVPCSGPERWKVYPAPAEKIGGILLCSLICTCCSRLTSNHIANDVNVCISKIQMLPGSEEPFAIAAECQVAWACKSGLLAKMAKFPEPLRWQCPIYSHSPN